MHPESDRLGETLREVRSYVPHNQWDRKGREQVIEALAELTQPFNREAQPTHITGSAVVASSRGTVLHLHRREQRWLQPGGHVDSQEGPWQTALRETREETGVLAHHFHDAPHLLSIDTHETSQHHVHLDLRYLLMADTEELIPGVDESPEVRWFAWDEALQVVAADLPLQRSLEAARDLLLRR